MQSNLYKGKLYIPVAYHIDHIYENLDKVTNIFNDRSASNCSHLLRKIRSALKD